MERSVGEHAAESSQPCLKGQISDWMLALEEANGGYRLKLQEQLVDKYYLEGQKPKQPVTIQDTTSNKQRQRGDTTVAAYNCLEKTDVYGNTS